MTKVEQDGFDMYDKCGGDESWKHWFALCSVDRVQSIDENLATGLRNLITSSMYSQLRRFGFKEDIVGNDNPVAFFDSYFLLDGRKKELQSKKPFKQYLLYRKNLAGISLRNLICGTLFSTQRGRIRDIVRDWIAVLKGWKPHSLTLPNGKRHIAWECSSFDENEANNIFKRSDVSYILESILDKPYCEKECEQLLSEIGIKIGAEKKTVALLLYVVAQDITVAQPSVLSVLGVAKSRAYKICELCMRKMKEVIEIRGYRMDDMRFMTALLHVCEIELGEVLIQKLKTKRTE